MLQDLGQQQTAAQRMRCRKAGAPETRCCSAGRATQRQCHPRPPCRGARSRRPPAAPPLRPPRQGRGPRRRPPRPMRAGRPRLRLAPSERYWRRRAAAGQARLPPLQPCSGVIQNPSLARRPHPGPRLRSQRRSPELCPPREAPRAGRRSGRAPRQVPQERRLAVAAVAARAGGR